MVEILGGGPPPPPPLPGMKMGGPPPPPPLPGGPPGPPGMGPPPPPPPGGLFMPVTSPEVPEFLTKKTKRVVDVQLRKIPWNACTVCLQYISSFLCFKLYHCVNLRMNRLLWAIITALFISSATQLRRVSE